MRVDGSRVGTGVRARLVDGAEQRSRARLDEAELTAAGAADVGEVGGGLASH